MARITAGACHELFAVMKDGKLVALVAKDPNGPQVVDVTYDVARLLHHEFSSEPVKTESEG